MMDSILYSLFATDGRGEMASCVLLLTITSLDYR